MRLVSRWFGSEQWGRMAAVLDYTAAMHLPHWDVDIQQVEPGSYKRHRQATAHHEKNAHKCVLWGEVVEEAVDGEHLCLIDTDTFLLGDLTPVWDEDFDIGITVKQWHPSMPISTGAVYVRVNDRVREFFGEWTHDCLEMLGDKATHPKWRRVFGGIHQPALARMLLRMRYPDLRIRALDDVAWNCVRPDKHLEDGRTRVVHLWLKIRQELFRPGGARRRRRLGGMFGDVCEMWHELDREANGKSQVAAQAVG